MLVLLRRKKVDGRILNLGSVIVSDTSMAIQTVGKVATDAKGRRQEVNRVELLHPVKVSDDTKAAEALLYLSGQSNFKTVEA